MSSPRKPRMSSSERRAVTWPRKGVNGEEAFRAWSKVIPRVLSRAVKASSLGRKIVAFREVLLNVLLMPVICTTHRRVFTV